MSEIATKPYLLRALYEWCVDNGYTPHVAVKVDSKTQVPSEYVKNGEITLNVSPSAVHKLQIGNELIEFSARNIALAFIVAVGSLGRLDLALFIGVYSMTGFPLVIGHLERRGDRASGTIVERESSRGTHGA